MLTKTCTACKNSKSLSSFSANKVKGKLYLRSLCKECSWKASAACTKKTPRYSSWASMIDRCSADSKHPLAKNYYGRGIRVCDEWKSYDAYITYISTLPNYNAEGYTLDRIDNNADYKPGNVKFSTKKEQANNRRPRS